MSPERLQLWFLNAEALKNILLELPDPDALPLSSWRGLALPRR